jgi:hypothetical protein
VGSTDLSWVSADGSLQIPAGYSGPAMGMLNVIIDYLEAEDEAERGRLYLRCVGLGKVFAKNLKLWIQKSNREAAFLGTPRVTRGPKDRRPGLGGVAEGGQGLGRIADALEQLVSLKRAELGSGRFPRGRASPSPFERPVDVAESPIVVHDSEDSQVYNHVLPRQVAAYRANVRARRLQQRSQNEDGQGSSP